MKVDIPEIFRIIDIFIEKIFNDSKSLTDIIKMKLTEISPNCNIQYIAVTDANNLDEIENFATYKGKVLISLAVFYGKTRLIDNILFEI